MKVYLVRWPGPCASLVAARDEDDLLDILDEVADSEGATWSVYNGPLHIDFNLPVKFRIEEKKAGVPLREDEIVVEDVGQSLTLQSPGGDTACAMMEAIIEKAFPRVHRVLAADSEDAGDALRAAAKQDLMQLIRAEWGKAARSRRTGPVADIANAMGMPVRQAENILRSSGQLPPEGPKAPGEVKPLTKKRRRPR